MQQERKKKIQRWREKKKRLNFNRGVTYAVRSNFARRRPRAGTPFFSPFPFSSLMRAWGVLRVSSRLCFPLPCVYLGPRRRAVCQGVSSLKQMQNSVCRSERENCNCWTDLGSCPREVPVWCKTRGGRSSIQIVSKYFLDQRRCVLRLHWNASCLRRSPPAGLKESLFKAYYGLGTLQARCMCCKVNVMSFVPGGQCCLAHIIPRCQGGPLAAWNLLPTCLGCNSRYSLNLLDFLGTREDLQRNTLRAVVKKIFSFHFPEGTARRKLRKLYGKKYLVHFVHDYYAPEHLQKWAHFLY